MMPQQPMMPPQQQMPMAPAGMSAQSQMPPQMFASGGSVKDVLLPDFSSIETLMQGLGGGVGVSDEGTAKWWNPVAGLPHVQYANLQATGEPMIGLPLGNMGNITQDVSEWAGVYKPPFEQWDQETIDKYLAKQKEENNMSGGGLLENMSGIGVMKNAMEGDMSMMGFLPLLYNQFKGDKDEEEEEAIPMSAGGLVRYAHGGRTEGATKAEQSVLRSLWDKMTRGQKEEMMSEPSEDAHVPFNSYEEARRYKEFIDSPEWEQLVPGGSYEEPPRMSAGGLVNFANGGQVDPDDNGFWSRPFVQALGEGLMSQHITEPQLYEYAEKLQENKDMLDILGLRSTEEAIAAGEEMPYETPAQDVTGVTGAKEFLHDRYIGDDDKFNYGTALLDAATVIPVGGAAFAGARGALNLGKAGLASGKFGTLLDKLKRGAQATVTRPGKVVKSKAGKEYSVHSPQGKAILSGKTPPKPVGSTNVPRELSGYRSTATAGALTGARSSLENGEDVEAGEEGYVYDEKKVLDDIQRQREVIGDKTVFPQDAIDAAKKGEPEGESVMDINDQIIKSKPSDTAQFAGNLGVTTDAIKGRQAELTSKLYDQIESLYNEDNQMDRKWLAIAAGAFNAAQKGAPTLMAGLADLGGGVSDELQKMDKEDQARAVALFDIYNKQETLAENKRKADLVYGASMYGHQADYDATVNKNLIDIRKAEIADLKDAKNFLQKSGADYFTFQKALNEGFIDDDTGYMFDAIYATQGVGPAQDKYNNDLDILLNKEREIISEVSNEMGANYNEQDPEHVNRATALYHEFLEDNPGLRTIRDDYKSGTLQSDWVKTKLIL
jgi:hypothetical protein